MRLKLLSAILLCLVSTLQFVPFAYAEESKTDSFTYEPSNWFGIRWFVNAYNVTPTTTGSWVGVNCSQYIPEDMTGVILDVHNTHNTAYRKVDVRHPESTDDFYAYNNIALGTQAGLAVVGINESRCFEAKLEGDELEIWLLGYTDDSVTFFVNAIDQSTETTGSWVDVDLSQNVSSDTTGVFYRLVNQLAQRSAAVRKAGSTDPVFGCVEHTHIWGGVGVNETKCIQQYVGYSDVDLYILGYTNSSSFTWYTNCVSTDTILSWVNIDAGLPQNATGIIMNIVNTNALFDDQCEVRHPDSTIDNYSVGRGSDIEDDDFLGHGCAVNGSGFFQGRIQRNDTDFYICGFTQNVTRSHICTLSEDANRISEITLVTVNGAAWSGYTRSAGNQVTVGLIEDSLIQVTYKIHNGDGDSPPIPPVGYHDLFVYVLYDNGTVVPHVKVSLFWSGHFWHNVADTNGTAVFRNLVMGEYHVTVLNQTKKVDIPFYDSVTFTFKTLPYQPENRFDKFLRQNWFPCLLIVCGIGLVVLLSKKK